MVPDSARSGHLDAARAFAALLVFSSHARGIFLSPWRASVGFMAGAVLKGGHAVSAVAPVQALKPSHQAVIIFFVLSGYFVGGSVMRSVTARNWSWRIYLSKRLVRLWLVLIPALILTLVLDGIGRHYAPTGALYSYAGANTPMLIDSDDLRTFFGNLFFVQGILTPALGSNDPLWSLAYEFWYYAAFPCLMLAIGASGISRRIVYLIALCVILFFVGREISLYFLVWLLGLAPHLLPRPKRQTSRWIVLGGACLLAGVAVELIKAGIGIFFADVILAMAFSGWCYLASNTAPGVRGSLYGRLSSGFSEFSYTLYLVHVPMLVLISALLVGTWRTWPFDFFHLAIFSAIWFGTLLFAFGVYFLFEKNTGKLQRWTIGKLFYLNASVSKV